MNEWILSHRQHRLTKLQNRESICWNASRALRLVSYNIYNIQTQQFCAFERNRRRIEIVALRSQDAFEFFGRHKEERSFVLSPPKRFRRRFRQSYHKVHASECSEKTEPPKLSRTNLPQCVSTFLCSAHDTQFANQSSCSTVVWVYVHCACIQNPK